MRNKSKGGQDREQNNKYSTVVTPQAALHNRMEVHREINSHKINLNRSVFKKTGEEKDQLSLEKSKWKQRALALRASGQEELMQVMASFLLDKNPRVPSFGGLTLIVHQYQ